MVPSDEIIASNEHHDLARTTPLGTKRVQPRPKPDSNMLNEVKVISEATKDQSTTIPNTGPNSFAPNSNDNRLYTVHLYLEKAIKGSADAQYQLGSLYLTGKGTLQDFEEAAKWFTSAAEQNHALAQYELGLLYHNGLGVNPDNEKSYVWLNLAAAAGIEQAVAARDKIMRSLTAKQLAQAQKTAREWLANQKNNSN
jgi:TPR repeat protein